jgi:hypothetical protein
VSRLSELFHALPRPEAWNPESGPAQVINREWFRLSRQVIQAWFSDWWFPNWLSHSGLVSDWFQTSWANPGMHFRKQTNTFPSKIIALSWYQPGTLFMLAWPAFALPQNNICLQKHEMLKMCLLPRFSNGRFMGTLDPSIPGNCIEFRPASNETSPRPQNQHVQHVCIEKHEGVNKPAKASQAGVKFWAASGL